MPEALATTEIDVRTVATNGIEMNVAVAGAGDPVVLLHGWPHTWRLWSAVTPALAERHRVIAPDLRGLGASTRAPTGYDAATVAADVAGLLDALGEPEAAVVAIDAGAPPAFMLGAEQPERVRRLVLMESLLGPLPGAEDFLEHGGPWWFGFHSVPGLAETVLAGHEAEYVDWFLSTGSARPEGIDPEIRDAFVSAYRGPDAMRCGFEYYRAMPVNARQIATAAARRLSVPTMAIGSRPVGDALERQLRPITDELTGHVVEDCGHLIPLDRPNALLALLEPFLAPAASPPAKLGPLTTLST